MYTYNTVIKKERKKERSEFNEDISSLVDLAPFEVLNSHITLVATIFKVGNSSFSAESSIRQCSVANQV